MPLERCLSEQEKEASVLLEYMQYQLEMAQWRMTPRTCLRRFQGIACIDD